MNENKRRTVVPLYAAKLRDFVRPVGTFRVQCGACRRTAELDILELIARYGQHTSIKDVMKKVRCSHCGVGGWAYPELDWH